MKQSKMVGFESNRHMVTYRQVPMIEPGRCEERDKSMTNASERFVFDEKKMEVSYFCGCCSLPNLTRS